MNDISAGALERSTISTVRSRGDYALDPAAENTSYEPSDLSSLPMTRVDATKLIRTLQHLAGMAKQRAPRIAIKAKGKILFLDVAEIVVVEAEGNYVSLRHSTNPYLLRESLSSMAEKLKPYGFTRIHRSVIVNTSAVEEIQPLPTGEYRLRVKGGKEYLVTRTYKHNLRDLAQLWLGSERLCG
jgi:DNA-binding LytR/AlgR family response regulator